ncbi:unnamed protein product [Heligmosomoides polygyrus]|uniref:Uncharacterized protein n=1 Tax=Heligmosomoides polygyrus TaxID=6339 RepID=A0A183GEF8_HELPZ|nr:unnamed protein product [Heligmosomoides polygyrus]
MRSQMAIVYQRRRCLLGEGPRDRGRCWGFPAPDWCLPFPTTPPLRSAVRPTPAITLRQPSSLTTIDFITAPIQLSPALNKHTDDDRQFRFTVLLPRHV